MTTTTRTRHIHIRIPEATYQRLKDASASSEAGETVSDVARAGILRELNIREKPKKSKVKA
jgi:hypothetical protein